MSRFLGIDLGTQSLKAIVYDSESREIAAAPGADGVVVLSFYNGDRTPNLPNGKGCILGLNDTNMTPANIVRASMESAMGAALNAMLLGSENHGDSRALAAEVDEHIGFDEQYGAVPDPGTQAICDQQFEIYNSYLDELRPLFERGP